MIFNFLQLPAILFVGWGSGILVNIAADFWMINNELVNSDCVHCSVRSISVWKYYLWPIKCAECGKIKPPRIWLVELIYMILTLFLWYTQSQNLNFLPSLILLIYFGVIWIIDIEHRIIPNVLIILGSILGLIFGISLNEIMPTIIGGFTGLIFMFIIYAFGHLFVRLINRLRETQLNEPAMGFGDVLFGGVVGLMVGFPDIIFSLTLTVIAAGLFAMIYMIVLLIIHRYKMGIAFPYAPFMILGTVYYLYIV